MIVRQDLPVALVVWLLLFPVRLGLGEDDATKAVDALKRAGFRFVLDACGAPIEAMAPPTIRQGGPPAAEHFHLLAAIPTLKALDCTDCKIGDETAKALSRITSLERLVLARTEITGSSFESLTTLTSLRSLVLDESPCTDDGLANICRLASIEDLSLVKTRITSQGLISCEKLTKLRQLNLSGTRTMPEGMATIGKLKGLRSLNLSGTGKLSPFCPPLANLKSLESLNVRGTIIDYRDYPWIDRLTDLRHLEVPSWSISRRALDALQSLAKLERLEIGGDIGHKPELSEALLALKDRFPKVTVARPVLRANWVRISADADERIVSIRLLRNVALPYIGELAKRGELSHLRHLTIADQKTIDTDLAPLASIESLRTVHLSDTSITRHGIAVLLENKGIEQIDVPARLVSEGDVGDFSSSHPTVRIVRE